MNQPLVSVIMPAYNVEKYIEKAIRSVTNQTYTNLELLVVNDGSPDNSAAIARSLGKSDSRVIVLDKENGGLSDARNFGMDYASGKFVFFIDSDDWVDPDFLEVAVATIVSKKARLVVFGYHQDNLSMNEELIQSLDIYAPSTIYQKESKNLYIDANLLGLFGYAWNKFYDLEYIKENKIRFTKGVSLVEDILFNAPIYGLLDKIVISEMCFYHYNNRQVPTLIKKFHTNAFDLYVLKTHALENFLNQWYVPKEEAYSTLALSLIDGIRYCIDNMIRFTSDTSLTKQIKYIHVLVSNPITRFYAPHYYSNSFSGKLYKQLIVSRQSVLLMLFLRLKKILHAH